MSRNTEATDDVKTWTGGPLNYKEGFFTQLATDELAKGINEEVVRAISAKRNEPEWMLEFRLNAYHAWLEMEEPHWLKAHYDKLLRGDNSIGEFYSVALTSGDQQADTGTKMIHIGKNTKSTVISKGISAGHSQNSYRGLVKIMPTATNARNFTQCDSMLIGANCGAHTFPYVECRNNSAQLEHEATTSRIGEDQLFYCLQRGISEEDAISMIVNGFCKDVFSELPLEFAVEAQKLLAISLEHSVG
ncbi:hypothetical protein A8W49_002628 [Escherichia coli]|nr:hypothetical protein [Escherichia coli]